MSALGAVSGYMIPGWTDSGLLRNTRSWLGSLVLGLAWVVLAISANIGGMGIAMVLGLAVLGVLYGWSGMRTELGRRTAGQLLGLRHYLMGGNKAELRRACEQDPNYFFRMAPFAMALGVGKAFAKAVGREKLDRCSYLVDGTDPSLTAAQWQARLAATAAAMDARMQNRYLEKLVTFVSRLFKK